MSLLISCTVVTGDRYFLSCIEKYFLKKRSRAWYRGCEFVRRINEGVNRYEKTVQYLITNEPNRYLLSGRYC